MDKKTLEEMVQKLHKQRKLYLLEFKEAETGLRFIVTLAIFSSLNFPALGRLQSPGYCRIRQASENQGGRFRARKLLV
ncbi:MAG: hypothetical protein HYY46_00135 [Deltaproteobacteria bacterium]|nr:hypothetical protein [Deltaproteobacteria bacterium]